MEFLDTNTLEKLSRKDLINIIKNQETREKSLVDEIEIFKTSMTEMRSELDTMKAERLLPSPSFPEVFSKE